MSVEPTIPPTAARAPTRGVINGPVLDAAHWGAMVKNLDPSTHRLYNAFGLTMGLYTGRQVMN